MQFHDPVFFILLPFIGVLFWFVTRRAKKSSLRFSAQRLLPKDVVTWRLRAARLLPILRPITLVLFVFALARPQEILEDSRQESLGVDIVLAIDCSGSMLAQDFKVNGMRKGRIDVVKDVVKDFVKERKGDRLGMVAFAARAYTVCPLTLDTPWLLANLERVKVGDIEDGTAVGSAIMSSINRLKNSQAKSKLVILLTDGVNNAGKVAPLEAAKAAQALGIKIYTIGAGTKGLAPYPVRGLFGGMGYQDVEIPVDDEMLTSVARMTNAQYYRAQDTESLRRIYKDIDSLEKSKFDEQGYREYRELFYLFLIPGLLLLLLELLLANSWLKVWP
jgi:Ca-activated chloride channel family protein